MIQPPLNLLSGNDSLTGTPKTQGIHQCQQIIKRWIIEKVPAIFMPFLNHVLTSRTPAR